MGNNLKKGFINSQPVDPLRHFRYHFHQTLHSGVLISMRLLMPTVTKGFTCFEGIKIRDISRHGTTEKGRFEEDTIAALSLIKSVDPRRFRRIQREIHGIYKADGSSVATYLRALKICWVRVDLPKAKEDQEWYLWVYATILIHEATHGAIHSRHVAYNKSLRPRIERLCVTETKRFAKKADTEHRQWSASLVQDFDERAWHPTWNATFWQRTSNLRKEARHILSDMGLWRKRE